MDQGFNPRSSHNLIEGIGNELLFALGAFFGMFIPILIMVINGTRQLQHIHPENAQNVEATREQLQQEHRRQFPDGHRTRDNQGQHDCPICLGRAEYAVETNCGHLFCGICIVTYWRHGTWLGAVRCPVCRTQVTILLPNFTAEETESNTEDKRTVLEHVNTYNRRFSGEPRPWMDYLRDLPTLLRHAFSEFFSLGGLIWMFRFRVLICFIAAILYFISPLDIIPEAAFGILGFLDDLFILFLLAIYISIIYRQIVQNRATRTET